MARLLLWLLGTFEVVLAGEPVTAFPYDKVRALLAYLAVEADRPHRRDTLTGLLWPDWPEPRARQNLSQALYALRQALADRVATPPPFLIVAPQTLQFNSSSDYSLDVKSFTCRLAASHAHDHARLEACDSCLDGLEQAMALYRGGFLEGFSVGDSPAFEEWALLNRERLHHLALDALDQLSSAYQGRGQYEAALGHAWRRLRLDPWREDACRALMRLLALSGQRETALAQYHACRRLLVEELGVEPAPETTQLYEQIREGQEAFARKAGAKPTARASRLVLPPPCPYRGLFAFREEEAPFFFGRQAFSERLVEAVHQRSMLAVIGPSGSGKSSVVFAGILPRLRHRPTTGPQPPGRPEQGWLIASFRPGSHPFYALAGALVSLLQPELGEAEQLLEIPRLAHRLRRQKLTVVDVVGQILHKRPTASRLLLVVDQFEEVYTLCTDVETCRRFLDAIVQLTSSAPAFSGYPLEPPLAWPASASQDRLSAGSGNPGTRPSPVHLILTLRADFLEQALSYRPLADALQDADVKLGPMTREELRQAIARPAEKQGVFFEAGLVGRIADEVGDESGNLPLLQFALTTLWERQSEGQLTHAAYEAIERVEGALAGYAERVYAELSPAEQPWARQVFAQMVRPGLRTKDTCRLATRAELGEEGWALARRLAQARLVVTDRDSAGRETAQIVHEALIHGWSRLQEWLNSDRAFRIWQERLRVVLHQWQAGDRDEAALLRGAWLAEAEGWAENRPTSLSPLEQEFLQASVRFRDQKLRLAEAQRERELAQAQALAEAERGRAELQAAASRRLRWLAAALATMFVLVLGAGAFALFQRNAARHQAQIALSRQLAAQASDQMDKRLALALLLSLQATQIADTTETRSGLLAALAHNPPLSAFLHGHTDIVSGVDFSPDGTQLASASYDGTVRLWEVASGQLLRTLVGHAGAVEEVAYSPGGSQLATVSEDGRVIVWDATDGRQLAVLEGHTGWVNCLAFSPDGRQLATGGQDQTVILWDVSTASNQGAGKGQPLARLNGHSGWISGIAYSPDGSQLATVGQDQTVFIWDLASGRPSMTLSGHTDWVWGVAFSPDGTQLATGSGDHSVILWDVASGQQLTRLEGRTGDVEYVAFSPDGTQLASVGRGIILWNVADGQPITILEGHADSVTSVAFSPDGGQLATGSADTRVILWNLASQPAPGLVVGQPHSLLKRHTGGVKSIAYHPSGTQLATGSADHTVILWDTASGLPLDTLVGHTDVVRCLAYRPDGAQLATGSADGTVMLWDLASGQLISKLDAGGGEVRSLAFSPDGTQLAVGTEQVSLWDVSTVLKPGLSQDEGGSAASAQPVTTLESPASTVFSLAYSPDGTQLAAGLQNQTVIVWDIASGQQRATLAGHNGEVRSVAYHPHGTQLATGAFDNTVILWTVATGQQRATLKGHTDRVTCVDYNSDGTQLASASFDQTIIVWDLAGQEEFLRIADSGCPITSVAFSPDTYSGTGSQILASGDECGAVTLTVLNAETWPALACRIANRNMTQAEWEEFIGPNIPYQRTCPNLPPG